jgi:AcrR family transcriptional regulator
MDDVAHAAGCARPTIYKHFANKEALLTALFLREVNRYLIALKEALESPGRADESPLEEAFAFTLAYLRGHDLVGKILVDPKGMLSVLALGGGAVLEAATRGVGNVLEPLIATGAVRRLEGDLIGEVFVRLIASFLLLPRLVMDPNDPSAVNTLIRECLIKGLGSSR